MSQDKLIFKGFLKGHDGWVTSIATTKSNPNMIVSGSRDHKLIVWELTGEQGTYGFAKKALTGHSHFVSDVTISSDGQFALSGSWDKTLRLWELSTGVSTRQFNDHEKDVLTVAFSQDNRQIISGSRDHTLKLWNTLGECKYTIKEHGHDGWVSCVRFAPGGERPLIVSAGYDKIVKVWELSTCKLLANLVGHKGYISTVAVSPDGSLCASGGKDGTAMLWDLTQGVHLYDLDTNDVINALVFSPNRYWLCAATNNSIKIWDLKSKKIVAELLPEEKNGKKPQCISLAWSADGSTLFSGYTDNQIRVWGVYSS